MDNSFTELPESTAADAIDEIVAVSRRSGGFPLRREFLQGTNDAGEKVPGPLASLVAAGDSRGLLLYLMLLTKASAEPWDARLPSAAWARALGIDLPNSKTARSTISKTWLRLEKRNLVARERSKRLADVFLLREDGSGASYTNPGGVGETYFRVPLSLWKEGPDETTRWYQVLNLPELVVLLIGRSLGDGFRMPFEMGPDWYGVSADTLRRGVDGLVEKELLDVEKRFKKAPLSPVGYTAEHRYTLLLPFGPVGRRSGQPAKPRPAKKAAKAKKRDGKASKRKSAR